MNGNDFIAWLLRSPFHGMLSSGTLLLTVTGRKTGNQYTTPVDYYEENGFLWVLSSRDRSWWRNLQGDGAAVALRLKGRPVNGIASLDLDEQNVQAHMLEYIQHKPYTAKPLGIRIKNKMPDMEDVARVAKDRLFVKIKLV